MLDPTSGLRPRHFQAFVAVCEERHVGRAAARLRLTQPAVSKTLAELEALLGRRLFDRGRHGATPTRHGAAFLPHARAVLDAIVAASRALGQPGGPATERVAVGALPTVAPELLPAALERFRAVAPDVGVAFLTATNTELLARLRAGDLDLAVGRMSDPSLSAELTFELLYLESLTVAVRPDHPLAGARHVALARVVEFPLVVCSPDTTPRQNAEALLAAHGLRVPPNAVETLDLAVARQVVLSTDAVWLVPTGAVRGDVMRGWLVALPVGETTTAEPVGLFMRTDRALGAAAASFLESLRAAAATRRDGPPAWSQPDLRRGRLSAHYRRYSVDTTDPRP